MSLTFQHVEYNNCISLLCGKHAMPSVLFRFAVIFTILFTVALTVLHARFVDDTDLRRLLLAPTACSAPCLMDVRAGETSGDDAMKLVEQHDWTVGEPIFIQPINDINTHYVQWRWSGTQPAGVDERWQGQMRVSREQVAAMSIRTSLPLGAVWLLLGGTHKGTIIPAASRPERDVTVIAVFPVPSLLVRVTLSKQASTATFWSSPVEIELTSPQAIAYFSQYRLTRWCSLRCSP